LQPLSIELISAEPDKFKGSQDAAWRLPAGSGRKPGVVSKRTIEAVKSMAPPGEQALGVLVEAMQNPKAPWS
jgi:hypothetical protein